jgi:hypothetical protein
MSSRTILAMVTVLGHDPGCVQSSGLRLAFRTRSPRAALAGRSTGSGQTNAVLYQHIASGRLDISFIDSLMVAFSSLLIGVTIFFQQKFAANSTHHFKPAPYTTFGHISGRVITS